MKKVQPKLKKLQERYKDDRMKLQQEMMALYKKEGANPMAGCLPIIPTIFVFFALYKAVFINLDLRHEGFMGYIKDLSDRDPLSIVNGFGIFPWDGTPEWMPVILLIGPLAILYGLTMSLMYTLSSPCLFWQVSRLDCYFTGSGTIFCPLRSNIGLRVKTAWIPRSTNSSARYSVDLSPSSKAKRSRLNRMR